MSDGGIVLLEPGCGAGDARCGFGSAGADESAIRDWGTLMGSDHPITWCQVYDGGRVWYTGRGHDAAAFANADSMDMIGKGISWAGGRWDLKGCDMEG
jgi:hypothetical protein